MKTINSVESKELIISSDEDNLTLVEDFIDEFVEKYKIPICYYANILVVVTEAVRNSVIHGNKSDIDKKVIITASYNNRKVDFIITDEGLGFNYNSYLKKIQNKSNSLEGNGISLIHNLADEIKYLDKGSKLQLQFKV